MKEQHPCPNCSPLIQKKCADEAWFPCEENMTATAEEIANAPHKPDVDREVEEWRKTLDIEELGRW